MLASTVLQRVPLVDREIQHVAGASKGIGIAGGSEPVIVALLRAGLFVAEGLWEQIPGASLVLHRPGDGQLAHLPNDGRQIVLVDAVINSGRSVDEILGMLPGREAGTITVVTLVGHRDGLNGLAERHPLVDFVAARVSDRSFVGRGSTDTGARLCGTTHWTTERA